MLDEKVSAGFGDTISEHYHNDFPKILTEFCAIDLCEFLDQHPDVEAHAMLSVNLSDEHRILDPREAALCQNVLQGDPVARAAFPAVRDAVMLRWATSRCAVELQPKNRGCEGKECSTAHLGAAAPAVPVISSSRPAGAQEAAQRAVPGTPAGRPWEVEWTFTRFPDGRIILEVPE